MSNTKTDSMNMMRRFTFAATNMMDLSELKQLSTNQGAMQLLKEHGLIAFELYQYHSISYLNLDMEPEFNFDKTKKLFSELSKQEPVIKELNELLGQEFKLLNCIYKMKQQYAYSAKEGQLIPKPRAKQARFVLTLEIINDPELAKEYAAIHGIGKAWPEITQNMKTVGIHEMELYLTGYRAFLIMDTKPKFNWDTDGELWGTLPREKEWQAYVAKFQKTDSESMAAEKWINMKRVN